MCIFGVIAVLLIIPLKFDDKRIATLAEQIFAAQAEDGAFLHGGFGHTKSWNTCPYMCLAHVMTYALARFGYLDDPRLERAYRQLTDWQCTRTGTKLPFWHSQCAQSCCRQSRYARWRGNAPGCRFSAHLLGV